MNRKQAKSRPDDKIFPEADRDLLREVLEANCDQGLGYPETAGFLFAMICAPRPVMPSEWIEPVLGERAWANMEEANRVLGALMSLNNWIAARREEGRSTLPPGVELRPEPMANFEADAPIRRWALGFLKGHGWVSDDWDQYEPDDPESGLALAVLGFFSNRKFADTFCAEAVDKPIPVEEFAETACRLLPEALVNYAAAGRKAGRHLQEAGQQPARSIKVGRNDPCPCGSGKKYKKCCLPKEQQSRERRPETVHAGPDFQGLSPEQMHKLIYRPFESPELVHFSDRLPTDPEAPVLGLLQRLVEGLGEKGLKATAKGNLPREFCRQAARDAGTIARESRWLDPERLRSETDYTDLHVTRLVAGLAGLIRKYKGRLVLTKKARKMLDRTGLCEIYPLLLKTYATKFNWAYRDRAAELPIVQHSFAFTLYLLDRLGTQWQPHHVYEDAFVQAFPHTLTEVPDNDWYPAERAVRNCYRWRTLQNFLEFFGLADMEALTDDLVDREYRIRRRPLLTDAVTFTVDAAESSRCRMH